MRTDAPTNLPHNDELGGAGKVGAYTSGVAERLGRWCRADNGHRATGRSDTEAIARQYTERIVCPRSEWNDCQAGVSVDHCAFMADVRSVSGRVVLDSVV